MIKADIQFIENNSFYDLIQNGEKVTGYELLFQIISEFKNKYGYKIHTYHELDKSIEFNFKGDYIIYLNEHSNRRYIELYSHTNNIEDFTEKFNCLKEIINNL